MHLKVTPEGIEVEGQTMKQLREMLQLGDEYQRNQSKVTIYEPYSDTGKYGYCLSGADFRGRGPRRRNRRGNRTC